MEKSLERVVSQRALQVGSSFPCQFCVVGFLSGVCIASFFLAGLTSPPSTNSTSHFINVVTSRDCNIHVHGSNHNHVDDHKISQLHSAWTASLSQSLNGENESSALPNAPPHLDNCKLSENVNKYLDTRAENHSFPPWTTWKGLLDMHPAATANQQLRHFRHQAISQAAYPPWITGSDEENYPLTRKVQRDIWIHQHPVNCRDPNVRFLVADWERLPGFGIGAQLAGMCGLLAIAIKEKRVLVTGYYNRADHDGCKGSSRSSWSCYFFPETSQECQDRAFELMSNKEAMQTGIITTKDNYKSKEIWAGQTPRIWGDPWSYMQPTTYINGSLITSHRKMDRRWWRAQAIRYLMRFQTEYTCNLMNIPRNAAFGKEVAKMVLQSVSDRWPKEVNEKSKEYRKWKFYYSKVKRQVGNTTMAKYEKSLGRKSSTNYPLVNFLMATEADFFIGALGSTWCFLIDGMRNTAGKVMAGYLSVNKDRFW